MARLDALFRHLKESGGSDLHLGAGLKPHTRVHGEMQPISGWPEFTDASLREHLKEIASAEQWAHFENNLDLDFAYALPGVARFRSNYLNQERGAAAVFRIIPERIKTLVELKMPAAVSSF